MARPSITRVDIRVRLAGGPGEPRRPSTTSPDWYVDITRARGIEETCGPFDSLWEAAQVAAALDTTKETT